MSTDNNMRLDVFPDMIHPADDWPGTIDPEIQAMADRGELGPDWTAVEHLAMLLRDMDAVAEHACKLSEKLPDDARILFQLTFGTRLSVAYDKLQGMKKYLQNCIDGKVSNGLRQGIADFGARHVEVKS